MVRFTAVESGGVGNLHGQTTLAYNAAMKTLTVTVKASGFMPGSPHAAHIHQGTCLNQGAPIYMLPDLVADANGMINATETITGVASFTAPTSGWYLNIHQGNSNSILVNSQPALSFRPLLCGNLPQVIMMTMVPQGTTTATPTPMPTTTTTSTTIGKAPMISPAPMVEAPRHW
jgi:hypothetical protein